MISSRDMAMPTNRAYGTCYAFPPMPHVHTAIIIWTSVFMPASPMALPTTAKAVKKNTR